MIQTPAQPDPVDVETLTRAEFLEEFAARQEPGQHSVFYGPTGRGKSTLIRDALDVGACCLGNIGILNVKGPDKAFSDYGKLMKRWPPMLPVEVHKYGEPRPFVVRLEGSPKADFKSLRALFESPLKWARGRGDWLWIMPDLQPLTDPKMTNLGAEVERMLLTLRAFGSSVWMDAQRPSWIPRAASDQVRHVVVFQNRDLGTVERLREILTLPAKEMVPLMQGMDRHDFLWLDAIEDELFYVIGRR